MGLTFIREGLLAGGARPSSGEGGGDELDRWGRAGVRGIVSLTELPLDGDELERRGFEYLHLPVPDFCAPAIQQVREFVDFVKSVNGRTRGAVAVHCGSGYGRTGTMLACFLVDEGSSAEEAVAEVRRLRPGSIETDGQESAVLAWERHLR